MKRRDIKVQEIQEFVSPKNNYKNLLVKQKENILTRERYIKIFDIFPSKNIKSHIDIERFDTV